MRAGGSVHPRMVGPGRAVRGRVLSHVRRGRVADTQPGALLAGPLALPAQVPAGRRAAKRSLTKDVDC